MAGIRPGDVVGGRYRIEDVIGATISSAVYAARHVELDQKLAVKVLLDVETPTALKRFRREAKLMARIQSDHVVRVIDFGIVGERTPYIVMEHLEGRDVQRVVREGGALDVTTACAWVLQACEGLATAHALGIVHRDIKPSNLFVVSRADGFIQIKIIDFGIAKLPQPVDPNDTFTRSDVVLGTPRYMSPEQTKGVVSAAETDVWALAIVLQEVITARPVFKADSLPMLFAKIVSEDPPSLRVDAPHAPEALERVISRALAKDPARRATLLEFARGVAPFAGGAADDRLARIEALSKLHAPIEGSTSSPSLPDAPWDSATTKNAPLVEPMEASVAEEPRPSQAPTLPRPPPRSDHTLAPVEPPARPKGRRYAALATMGIGLAVAAGTIVMITKRQPSLAPAAATSSTIAREAEAASATSEAPTSTSIATSPVPTASSQSHDVRDAGHPAPSSSNTRSYRAGSSPSASRGPDWTHAPE